jgi:hypothetical protein
LNDSVREFTPIVTSSPTINASNKRHLCNNLVRHSGQTNIPRTPHFEEKCEELQIQVYDATHIRQADQFTKPPGKYVIILAEHTSVCWRYIPHMHITL